MIAEYNSNHAQKWGQICCKSVQLVIGSSFWNDLLQNPYFSTNQQFGACVAKAFTALVNFIMTGAY